MTDESLVKYYNARAPEYEQIYYRDDSARQVELAAARNRLNNIVNKKRVLELASGTGYWTEVMSHTATEIMAVDLSAEMIIEAGKKEYACPVNFDQADIGNLPVKGSTFDIVAIGFWFSHQPKQDYGEFFENITKPLSPDGKIWMIDNNLPAEGNSSSVRTDQHGNHFKRRYLDSGEEHIILKNYFTQDELEKLFSGNSKQIPHFKIERLDFGKYYWAILLAPIGRK